MREQRVSERVTRRLHSEIMRALGRMNGIKYYMLFFTLAWVCAPAFAALIAIEQKNRSLRSESVCEQKGSKNVADRGKNDEETSE